MARREWKKGKGAQYGLRKSQWCQRNGLLPELRQSTLRRLRAQRGRRADSLRAVLDGMAHISAAICRSPGGYPNPAAAAVLGLIPGVGAMYNGQFIKGLIHVVIFAVLVSAAHLYGIFGLFIAAWVLYQSFEAYHTARARRDGQPLPDPLGLNEVGNWLNPGARGPYNGQPGYGPAGTGPMGQSPAGPNPARGQSAGQGPAAGYQGPYQQASYQATYSGPATGYVDPGAPPVPPIPPVPPVGWRRKEPIGAIVLIGLGLLFLLGQLISSPAACLRLPGRCC